MSLKNIVYIIVGILGLSTIVLESCVPPQSNKTLKLEGGEVAIDLKNKEIQQLLDIKDQRNFDSLRFFLTHQNPTFRYLAAIGFAASKDSTHVDWLTPMLNDPSSDVCMAAAFSLGQIGNAKSEGALVAAFRPQDSLSSLPINRAILEALGKCGSESFLKAMATVTTYRATDTILLEGQMRGIYYYGLREILTSEGTNRAIEVVTNQAFPTSIRTLAANYLSRFKTVAIDSATGDRLGRALNLENAPEVRMCLVQAVARAKTYPAFATLVEQFGKEKDYRVQCNIARSMSNFPYKMAAPPMYEWLRHSNRHVSVAVAQYFLDNGSPFDAGFYWKMAKDTLHWQTQLTLYGAAHKYIGASYTQYKELINNELVARFQRSQSPAEKSFILKALGQYPWNYKNIYNLGYKDASPFVKTTAAEAIKGICEIPNFWSYFGSVNSPKVRYEIFEILVQSINSGDDGLMVNAAQALRIPNLEFKKLIADSTFLVNAMNKLSLPKQIETKIELQNTMNFLQGLPEDFKPSIKYNNPINWQTLNNMTPYTKAIINTKAGNITVQFYPQQAPGSVANFIQLANSGFFNGKSFHRVVSNFVIQGGCPRGDGYGALDYSIRSEFFPMYYENEGYLGMASAGADTECSQFFITNSPTPHLSGRYTIFGKVIEGLETIHNVYIGDAIQSVTIVR